MTKRSPGSSGGITRRTVLAGGGVAIASGLAGIPALAGAQPRRGSVLRFGADPGGKEDSSRAFADAIQALDVIDIPAGQYLVGDVDLRAGVTLQGEGDASTLHHRPGASHVLRADSGSERATLGHIRLAGLRLKGDSDSAGFSEHLHLVSLNGVSEVAIERVTFEGFRGDGIYLGSSEKGHTERHNRNVAIRQCVFDGVNGENRNGVSAIDCDGLIIEGCTFRRLARQDMPGAIDLEPNAEPYHVVRNIRIVNNRFADVGGGVGVIGFHIPTALTTPVSNVLVERNIIEGKFVTAFNFFQATPAGGDQNIIVRDNHVRGRYQRPFQLHNVAGVTVTGNEFDGAEQSAEVGTREPDVSVRDFTLSGNVFRNCGSVGGVGVSVFSVDGLTVDGNTFIDCGNGQPASYVFDFNAGASHRVAFRGNHFLSPTGRSKLVVQREAKHQFDPASNAFETNNEIAPGLRNNFQAR